MRFPLNLYTTGCESVRFLIYISLYMPDRKALKILFSTKSHFSICLTRRTHHPFSNLWSSLSSRERVQMICCGQKSVMLYIFVILTSSRKHSETIKSLLNVQIAARLVSTLTVNMICLWYLSYVEEQYELVQVYFHRTSVKIQRLYFTISLSIYISQRILSIEYNAISLF